MGIGPRGPNSMRSHLHQRYSEGVRRMPCGMLYHQSDLHIAARKLHNEREYRKRAAAQSTKDSGRPLSVKRSTDKALQIAARKALIKARRIKEMVGKRQQAKLAASPNTPVRAKKTLGKKSIDTAIRVSLTGPEVLSFQLNFSSWQMARQPSIKQQQQQVCQNNL
jgi:hypothetical protein